MRRANAAGIALIKGFEGLRLQAYRCPAGVWTIGYGHTKGVSDGDIITESQAGHLLGADMESAETTVEVRASYATDNQFAAMVALAFNIGNGAFRSSTVLREHIASNHAKAADAFLMWNKAKIDGVLQPVAGLTRRRKAERDLYLTPEVV
jgi:lysozyme